MDSIVGGNPFDYRRMGGILQGQAPTRPSLMPQNPWMDAINRVQPPPTNQPAQSQDPLFQALQRMQGGQATQAYRQHVGNIPQPEDYAPSRTRRLGSALTAAAASFGKDPQNAMALGSEIRDAPLKSAVTQWQMKGAGLKEQAGLEHDDAEAQVKYLTMVRQMEKDRNDQRIAQQNADSLSGYREAQINKLRQANWHETTDAEGNTVFVDPENPQNRVNYGPSEATTRLANEQKRLGFEGRRVATGEDQARTYKQAVAGFVSPDQQMGAEAMAARNIGRKPEYAKWVDQNTGQIYGVNDFFPTWMGGNRPDVTTPEYQRFLQEVEEEKQRLMSVQRPAPLGGMGRGTMLPPPPPGGYDYNSLQR